MVVVFGGGGDGGDVEVVRADGEGRERREGHVQVHMKETTGTIMNKLRHG